MSLKIYRLTMNLKIFGLYFLSLLAFYAGLDYSVWFTILGGLLYGLSIQLAAQEKINNFTKAVNNADMMEEFQEFLSRMNKINKEKEASK